MVNINDLDIQSKEDAIKLQNALSNKYGITFKEMKESYSNSIGGGESLKRISAK